MFPDGGPLTWSHNFTAVHQESCVIKMSELTFIKLHEGSLTTNSMNHEISSLIKKKTEQKQNLAADVYLAYLFAHNKRF